MCGERILDETMYRPNMRAIKKTSTAIISNCDSMKVFQCFALFLVQYTISSKLHTAYKTEEIYLLAISFTSIFARNQGYVILSLWLAKYHCSPNGKKLAGSFFFHTWNNFPIFAQLHVFRDTSLTLEQSTCQAHLVSPSPAPKATVFCSCTVICRMDAVYRICPLTIRPLSTKSTITWGNV